MLATGDQDGTIRLRDPETGQVAKTWRGHERGVSLLAFSPDGRRLGSVGHPVLPPPVKSEVQLWEIDSGRLLARLEGFSDREVQQIAFDARGERLWEASWPRGEVRGLRLSSWNVSTEPAHPRMTWSRVSEDAPEPRQPTPESDRFLDWRIALGRAPLSRPSDRAGNVGVRCGMSRAGVGVDPLIAFVSALAFSLPTNEPDWTGFTGTRMAWTAARSPAWQGSPAARSWPRRGPGPRGLARSVPVPNRGPRTRSTA
jgi:hypothetical protein